MTCRPDNGGSEVDDDDEDEYEQLRKQQNEDADLDKHPEQDLDGNPIRGRILNAQKKFKFRSKELQGPLFGEKKAPPLKKFSPKRHRNHSTILATAIIPSDKAEDDPPQNTTKKTMKKAPKKQLFPSPRLPSDKTPNTTKEVAASPPTVSASDKTPNTIKEVVSSPKSVMEYTKNLLKKPFSKTKTPTPPPPPTKAPPPNDDWRKALDEKLKRAGVKK